MHLCHNLAEAVERAVTRHRSCLQEPPRQPDPGPPAEEALPPSETGLAARTRARHAEVCTALARGLTITEISRTLRLERKTVRRYATAATADHLISGPRLTRPGPAQPAPGLPAPAPGRRHPQHPTAAPGTTRTRLPRQPAHPAPAHGPAPPGHCRPRGATSARSQESSQLDPHPARQAHRRPPGRAHADHRPLRGTGRHPRPGPRVRRHAVPPPRRAPGSLGCPGRDQPGQRATRIRQRTPQRLGRSHRRAHRLLQFRRRRRPRQPHQDDQKTDVRTREPRPAPQARLLAD
jgi:hypothetical protein